MAKTASDLIDDDAYAPAVAAGFHVAGTYLVEALAATGPEAVEFLRLVRARARAAAATTSPPPDLPDPLTKHWNEAAVAAIDHIFAHGIGDLDG